MEKEEGLADENEKINFDKEKKKQRETLVFY